ncbi:MAG: hypothetical protein J5605_07060 [Bacteroidales bacterium]|nr:hypothetical protein [Bacteroidales bacterium]
MRYYTYRQKRKRRILLYILLAIVFFILCLFAIRNCSRESDNSIDPPPDEPPIVVIDSQNTPIDKNDDWGEMVPDDTVPCYDDYCCVSEGENDELPIDTEQVLDETQDTSESPNGDVIYDYYPEENPPPKNDIGANVQEEDVGNSDENGSYKSFEKNPRRKKIKPPTPRSSDDNTVDENPPDENPPDSYRSVRERPGARNTFNPPGKSGNNTIGIVIFIILFIVFIISKVFSRNGLVIWVSTFDKFLVIAAAILYFVSCLFDNGGSAPLPPIVITLRSLSGTMMLISIALSIIFNFPNLLYIILSVLDKLFVFYSVMVLSFLGLILILVYFMFGVARRSRDNI